MTLAKFNPKSRNFIRNIPKFFNRLLQRPRILSGQHCCVPFMQKKHAIRLQMKKKSHAISIYHKEGGWAGVRNSKTVRNIKKSLYNTIRNPICICTCTHYRHWIWFTTWLFIRMYAPNPSLEIGGGKRNCFLEWSAVKHIVFYLFYKQLFSGYYTHTYLISKQRVGVQINHRAERLLNQRWRLQRVSSLID